jgi:hypothetical protein
MTNKKFWLGILALTLIFGMTVVGCGGDDDGDSGGGTLTVTNIPPQYNGMYAYFETSQHDTAEDKLLGCETVNTSQSRYITGTPVQISNEKVSLSMWKADAKVDGYYASTRYSGNDTAYHPNYFFIFNTATQGQSEDDALYFGVFQEAITFSNGSATKSWNDLSLLQ